MVSFYRKYLKRSINAAETATKAGVESGTHLKQALAWTRYKLYIKSIAIHDDDFLEQFTIFQRNKIMGAFAQALRDGRFYKTGKESKQKQLEPPSIAWHRPTVWPIDPIQGSTKMDDLHSFYFDSYEDIRSSTLPQNNKLLLPEQSSESSTISP